MEENIEKKGRYTTYVNKELMREVRIRLIQTGEFKSFTNWLETQMRRYMDGEI